LTDDKVPAIRLSGVSKRFGEKVVLDAIDLTVPKGQSLVVLGKSGIGKSVLLKHIIGLLKPDAGTVEIDGQDLWTLKPVERDQLRRKFGMSFQEGALFDSMTVGQNIAFPLKRHTKLSRADVKARVAECLGLVHLEGIEDKRTSELSGGMRRRVGFARAIALKPQILLFDEPNTGLDPVIKALIDELIISMRETLGSTTVTITHDMRSAFRIADRIGMLHQGKIIALAPPDEFRELDNPIVQQFIHGRADGPLST
jgi:phospholipid/cholesterol/gamma-HCH transport system ATP-binding protein